MSTKGQRKMSYLINNYMARVPKDEATGLPVPCLCVALPRHEHSIAQDGHCFICAIDTKKQAPFYTTIGV